jgi:hypothetical protein
MTDFYTMLNQAAVGKLTHLSQSPFPSDAPPRPNYLVMYRSTAPIRSLLCPSQAP